MNPFTCDDHTEVADGYIAHGAQRAWFRSHGYQQRKCGECGRWAVWLDREGHRAAAFTAEVRRSNGAPQAAYAPSEPYEGDPDEAIDMVAAWIGARLTLGAIKSEWPYPGGGRAEADQTLRETEAWLLERGLIHPTD